MEGKPHIEETLRDLIQGNRRLADKILDVVEKIYCTTINDLHPVDTSDYPDIIGAELYKTSGDLDWSLKRLQEIYQQLKDNTKKRTVEPSDIEKLKG